MVIGKNMNKLIFQEVQEKMVTGVTSQRLQECAKICVKSVNVQRTGKSSLQMFVYFTSLLRPSESL